MQLSTVTPFSVLFDNSFFTCLLKEQTQLTLRRDDKDRWLIVVLQDKAAQTPDDWKEIVDKVCTLFREAQKGGGEEFARLNIAEIKASLNVTLVANVQTLYSFIDPIEPISEETPAAISDNSRKRNFSQGSALIKKRKESNALEIKDESAISQEDLILAFKSTFSNRPSCKLKILSRANYLEVMPADIHFIVEDETGPRKIGAHRSVLCLYEYWEKMFKSGLTESCKSEILINDVSPDIFEMVMDFIYQSDLEYFIHDLEQPLHILEKLYAQDCQVYQELSQVANRFQISFLETLCQNRLEKLHECLTQWYHQKRIQSGESGKGQAKNPESREKLFTKQLTPYLKLLDIWGRDRFGLIDPSTERSYPCIGYLPGKVENIIFQEAGTNRQVAIHGSRALLAGRSLYFRQLLCEQAHGLMRTILPPQWILQSFASCIQEEAQTYHQMKCNFLETPQTYTRDFIHILLFEILQESKNEREMRLAQIAQLVAPWEFPLDGWHGGRNRQRLKTAEIDPIIALSQILKYFGPSVKKCSIDGDWEKIYGEARPQAIQLVVQFCPHVQDLLIEDATINNLENILQSLPELEVLCLDDYCKIGSSIESTRPSHPRLKRLEITRCKISEKAYQLLAAYARHISLLYVAPISLEGHYDDHFFTLIESIEKLKECNLYRLRAEEIQRILESDMNLGQLTSIMLDRGIVYDCLDDWQDRAHIKEWSEETLLRLSSRCPLLTQLPLAGCQHLKEKSVLTLIDRHAELTWLDLRGVRSLSNKILHRIGQKSKKLNEFECDSTQITLDALENLFTSLSSLQKVTLAHRTQQEEQYLQTKYPDITFTFVEKEANPEASDIEESESDDSSLERSILLK
jgi:hypothetical protein